MALSDGPVDVIYSRSLVTLVTPLGAGVLKPNGLAPYRALTMMMGHLSLAVGYPNEVGSEVE